MSYQSRFAEPLIPKLSSDIIDDRVLIFRITHIENIELIVRHGLCSKNYFEYSNYKNIGAIRAFSNQVVASIISIL